MQYAASVNVEKGSRKRLNQFETGVSGGFREIFNKAGK